MIYLVEIDAYNFDLEAVTTLRYSTGLGYINGITGHFYEPRIEQPALLSREAFTDLNISGRSTAGYGELTLCNIDGALDYFKSLAFDGRTIVIKIGDENDVITSFITVFKGTMTTVSVGYTLVAIRLRDRQAELDKPLQAAVYSGDNVLPNGLEGGVDLKEYKKPLLFGVCYNVSPILVNSSRLIYQVSTSAVDDVNQVFDKGAALIKGTDYANQIDMESNTPAAGYFRVWPAGGMFRLGSSPAGAITCDAYELSTFDDNTLGGIIQRIVTSVNGISIDDVISVDLADFNDSGVFGLYVTDDLTISDAIDQLLAGFQAWWGFNNIGQFTIKRLEIPGTVSVAHLTLVEILSLDQRDAVINNNYSPTWKVSLGYRKNWTIQDAESLAGSVPVPKIAFLTKQYRYVAESNIVTQDNFKLSQDITVDTLSMQQSRAVDLAFNMQSFLGKKTFFYDVELSIDITLLSVLDLGAVLSIDYPRFGLATIYMPVVKIEADYQNNKVRLTLWRWF